MIKSAIASFVFILTVFYTDALFAQEPTKAVVKKYSQPQIKAEPEILTKPGLTKRKYISLSFILTSGLKGNSDINNPVGGEFSYLWSTSKRHEPSRYFIGWAFSVVAYSSKHDIYIPGAYDSQLKTAYGSIFFGFAQRYYFCNNSTTIPFIDLKLGYRFSVHQLSADYKWTSYIPFIGKVNSSTSEQISNDSSSQFSVGLKGGWFFKVWGLSGFYVKGGFDTCGSISVANRNSVIYNGVENYQFDSSTNSPTNSFYLSIDVGFML